MISQVLKFILVGFLIFNLGVTAFTFLTPKPESFASPVSGGQVLGAQFFFYSTNLWKPNIELIKESSLSPPQINAKSALVVDLTTNEVLYAKNSKEKLPVASTVKILTAVVALEHLKPSKVLTVSETASKVGEDFMGLTPDEKLTLEELLYGLLLPSGNDAAAAIAEGVAGSVSRFVDLMNTKAQILGAVDSKFVNPSGLEGDGEHYSTAADLAIISKYAWENFAEFRRIVGTKYHEIAYAAGTESAGDYTPEHKYFYLENQTNLLGTYPGVKGIKPGFTPEAGLCLVTLAENGGHQILGVVLGATDRRGDMEKLLNYSFAAQGVQI